MPQVRIQSTIRQQIYEILHDRIIDGYYPAGARLSEQQICDEFHISRSPVREAFRNLETAGLLEGTANKGVRVRTFTAKDISNLYQVENMVQSLGVSEGLENLSTEQAERFRTYRGQFVKAYESGNLKQYLAVSDQFHNDITALSGNELIVRMYHQIGTMNHRFRMIGLKNPERLAASQQEHLAMIDAILAKDTETLTALLRRHTESASKYALMQLPDAGIPESVPQSSDEPPSNQ